MPPFARNRLARRRRDHSHPHARDRANRGRQHLRMIVAGMEICVASCVITTPAGRSWVASSTGPARLTSNRPGSSARNRSSAHTPYHRKPGSAGRGSEPRASDRSAWPGSSRQSARLRLYQLHLCNGGILHPQAAGMAQKPNEPSNRPSNR